MENKLTFSNSDSLCRYIRERTDKVLLRFSTGKDSICSWLKLRRYFAPEEILPVYQAFVPSITGVRSLYFVEQNLEYYENFFETNIIRVIHPHFYAMLQSGVFQTPERVKIIQSTHLPLYDNNDIFNLIRSELRLPANIFIATGFKAVDKLERDQNIKAFGPLNEKTFTFFPIYDWTEQQVIQSLRESKIQLPVEYKLFAYSFTTSLKEGFHPRILENLYRYFPQDYETIKFWFPLCDLQLHRLKAINGNNNCVFESQTNKLAKNADRYNSQYALSIERLENKITSEIQPLIQKLKISSNKYAEEFVSNQSWVCIVFRNSITREKFLLETGLGDKNTQYIDGDSLAPKMNVHLDTPLVPSLLSSDLVDELSNLALPLPAQPGLPVDLRSAMLQASG